MASREVVSVAAPPSDCRDLAGCAALNISESLFVESHAALLDFCENNIGQLPGVRRVEPWLILRMYKAFGTRTTSAAKEADAAGEAAQ